MITLTINDREIKAAAGQTILQAARENRIEIPTLCYDERVKPFASCGICVVEVAGSKKLSRSCATEVQEGMQVQTESPRVRQSRKLTLEMLLSDHRGDCCAPCRQACPADTDCQAYVGLIANGQFKEALAVLKGYYPLPASIGLICPHPCESACRRSLVEEPVSIAALKAFVGRYYLEERKQENDDESGPGFSIAEVKAPSEKKVAVVGAGPAGLTVAYFLAREGHQIEIFEAMPAAGGMLRYGIPDYRLPKKLLEQEIDLVARLGVKLSLNTRLGQDIFLEQLRENYDAVFLGIGAWVSSKIGCAGEETRGVLGGIEFLRAVASREAVFMGERVAVIGGGNTAMDAARTAIRLGAAEVMVLYRRSRAEMPAGESEIVEAEEEGIVFRFLLAPEEILEEDGRVAAIRMQKMQLGEPDASGRRRPEPTGEEEIIAVDTVIAAIGQQVDRGGLEKLELSRWNTIASDPLSFMSSMEGVFAGGDGVTGPGIAIEAIAQGRKAAQAMNAYLQGEKLPDNYSPYRMSREVRAEDLAGIEKEARIEPPSISPERRVRSFAEVKAAFTPEEALREAGRCLECGCSAFYECKLLNYAGKYEVKPQRLAGEIHRHSSEYHHPFLNWDTDKCILCGLCVRICDEVMGITALGLVNRGFDTVVKPEWEWGNDLEESACNSCGECAAVCPTGALSQRKRCS
ncbi:MAG: FAD-dependent oxidoreductase [Syntrophomonas sp.]|uniref:FAD-dependent oxidoreductase n=1 Tax=Syntrophomonas sp. TaxID=2053627 RepID=UPI0026235E99|nr:FAD-dependent oxidoreductase [Syntrophomonas sp.]MDD3878776.1 FAD-dependent oxidoreductase [Syntrophomonas sp.]MDD4625913.1 FAD-dependent oxidoreductase [Syntrophomonas sp.]